MADYSFDVTAQQWRQDPYYVASSAPIQKITVIASTKQGAVEEARRVLGTPDAHRYWRVWIGAARDVRLVAI